MYKTGFQDMKIKQTRYLPVKEYEPRTLMQSKVLSCGYTGVYGFYEQPSR